MTTRLSYWLAVLLLLAAGFVRLWHLSALPPGFNADEIENIRITETVRQGRIEVFYDLGGEGREGMYPTILAAVTSVVGDGLIGYRLLSVWSGMLTLALVYTLTSRLAGPLAGVAALALLTFSMWSTLLARMVVRETLTPIIVTGAMLALASAFSVYQRRRKRVRVPNTTPFAALGVLLGIGLYIHPVSFAIILFCMGFIAFMVITRQPMSRHTTGYASFALLVMIIIITPYVISSIRLPELGGATRLFGGYTLAQMPPLSALSRGIGGMFVVGENNAALNLPGRPLLDLISWLLVIVGFITALRYWRQPRFALPLIATILLLPVALLRATSPDFLADAPLFPLLALLFGLGVASLYNSLPRISRRMAAGGLVALLAFNIVWMGRDMFMLWPPREDVQAAYDGRLAKLAHYLDRTADDIPTVICTDDLSPNNPVQSLSPRRLLALMMHREDAPIRFADCGTGLILANGGDRQQAVLLEADLLNRLHPRLRDWLRLGQPLETDPQYDDIPPASILVVNVGAELADTIGRFTTTAPAGYAPESPGGAEAALLPVQFEGNLTFLGYDREIVGAYRPGDIVTVVTYWRVDGVLPPDLRLFTHILADPAVIAAQTDTLSVTPTELQPRDVFIQVTFVRLPPSIPSGTYSISIGAYQSTSDTRLAVLDSGDDQPRGTRLFLNQITVERE